MISNPNLIFYTCVATGTMILAEFNSRDTDMATLALKCIEKTPKHHITFTHTVHDQSHTFLIDGPFVYFAIYDKRLEYLEALSYLKSVRDAFDVINHNSGAYQSHNLSPHCFQGEFNPVFHQLLASNVDFETPFSPRVCKTGDTSLKRAGNRFGSTPLLGGTESPGTLKKKKKKRFSNVDGREGLYENKLEFMDGDLSVSEQRNGGLSETSSSKGSYKAKRVWKRHVWVVLILDLVICLILFCVWLWICKGFKCIDK